MDLKALGWGGGDGSYRGDEAVVEEGWEEGGILEQDLGGVARGQAHRRRGRGMQHRQQARDATNVMKRAPMVQDVEERVRTAQGVVTRAPVV